MSFCGVPFFSFNKFYMIFDGNISQRVIEEIIYRAAKWRKMIIQVCTGGNTVGGGRERGGLHQLRARSILAWTPAAAAANDRGEVGWVGVRGEGPTRY